MALSQNNSEKNSCFKEMHDTCDTAKSSVINFTDKVDEIISHNPKTGKPYFKINENGFNGEWVAGEVKPIPDSEFGGDDE